MLRTSELGALQQDSGQKTAGVSSEIVYECP